MSVNKNDESYNPNAQWGWQPFLNGEKVKDCFTADEDLGYVMVHKRDSDGKIMLNDNKTEILTDRLFGKVELRKVT